MSASLQVATAGRPRAHLSWPVTAGLGVRAGPARTGTRSGPRRTRAPPARTGGSAGTRSAGPRPTTARPRPPRTSGGKRRTLKERQKPKCEQGYVRLTPLQCTAVWGSKASVWLFRPNTRRYMRTQDLWGVVFNRDAAPLRQLPAYFTGWLQAQTILSAGPRTTGDNCLFTALAQPAWRVHRAQCLKVLGYQVIDLSL